MSKTSVNIQRASTTDILIYMVLPLGWYDTYLNHFWLGLKLYKTLKTTCQFYMFIYRLYSNRNPTKYRALSLDEGPFCEDFDFYQIIKRPN